MKNSWKCVCPTALCFCCYLYFFLSASCFYCFYFFLCSLQLPLLLLIFSPTAFSIHLLLVLWLLSVLFFSSFSCSFPPLPLWLFKVLCSSQLGQPMSGAPGMPLDTTQGLRDNEILATVLTTFASFTSRSTLGAIAIAGVVRILFFSPMFSVSGYVIVDCFFL